MVAPFYIWYTVTMELTNSQVKDLFAKVIGKKVWNARETLGIKFELGTEIENGQGEFHFWISTSHWWLQQGTGSDFEDIVHSESSEKNLNEKIKILDGKRLVSVGFHKESLGITFDFDDGLFLRVAPYGGKKLWEQFQMFTSKEIISVMSDGTYHTESVK